MRFNFNYNGNAIWSAISIILAIIGGILAYFLFVKKDDELKSKFLQYLRKFLRFDVMLIEPLLKVIYIILAIYITLISFGLISESFGAFILVLVIGNLSVRLVYEGILILIQIWKNTTDINKKMK